VTVDAVLVVCAGVCAWSGVRIRTYFRAHAGDLSSEDLMVRSSARRAQFRSVTSLLASAAMLLCALVDLARRI